MDSEQAFGDSLLRQWAGWVKSEPLGLWDSRSILWRMIQRRMDQMPGGPALDYAENTYMRIDTWVAKLHPMQRHAVKLRYLGGQDQESNARRLGVSRGTYYRLLARVQRRLAYEFDEIRAAG